ncbi:STY0301 family protein [Chitinivorax sp. B]|uniref:STY0301 family protein n=1 Tax=Chitinivorax sp. B TaxID=2502235 RepID=UPI0010F8F301|nr:STY0301 family protein [Chitinivorax sp. B]
MLISCHLPRLASLGLVMLISAQTATAQNYTCPEFLEVKASAESPGAPWEITQDKGSRGATLATARFYDGPPADMANLAPDQSTQNKRERKSIWHFAASKPRKIWVACSYHQTDLMATQALPDHITQCQITEQLLANGSVLKITGISCR